MSTAPPLAIAEHFAVMARALREAIDGQILGRVLWGRIPAPLATVLTLRIQAIRNRFAALALRIVAGTYRPRRFAPRRHAAVPQPGRQHPPRPKFGWLDQLLPPAVATQQRAHLDGLCQDPEMQALIAAAPAPMARLLRPLFWMLKLKPPAILAAPRRPPGTPPPDPAPYRPPPPRPAPLPPPANTLGLLPIQFGVFGPAPKPA